MVRMQGMDINIDAVERHCIWQKYGKCRADGRLELLHDFDSRVYALGLKAIEKQGGRKK